MTAMTSTIANLLNGVSTQASALRLPTQGEEQENGYSTLTRGLRKRPPTTLIRNVGSVPEASNALVHLINRDLTERYIAFITNGNIRVFGLDGTEKNVSYPQGKAYLSNSNPKNGFAVITVADYTFIVNRNITTRMSAQRSPKRPPEALVNVMTGNYSKNYKVLMNDNWQIARFLTGDGTTSEKSPEPGDYAVARKETENIGTDHIAHALAFGNSSTGQMIGGHLVEDGITGLDSGDAVIFTSMARNLPAGEWSIKRFDSAVHVMNNWGREFALKCSDGFGGNAMKVIKKTVQSFSYLPSKAPNGFHCEVTGQSSNNFDNYYVKFVSTQNLDNGEGVWKETCDQDIPITFEPTTMPHVLIREADGSFTFKPASWDPRTVGNEESNPVPSFINNPINDVFFHRNRLGFVSGENVIMSESSSFFNFWRRTVTSVLDTDPIDVGPSHTRVSIFKYAYPYGGDLLLFGESLQMRLTGGDMLTPKTAAMKTLSEFNMYPNCRPTAAGTLLFFTANDGARAVVRELYLNEDETIQKPNEVNAHCADYIPKNIFHMSASADLNMMVALSEMDRSTIYVYKYHWMDQQKPQSSWSKWNISGHTILSAKFFDTDLFIITICDGEVRILKMPCQVDHVDPGMDFPILLDERVQLTGGVYNSSTDETTYAIAYNPPQDGEVWVGANGNSLHHTGFKVIPKMIGSYSVVTSGDTRDVTLYFGRPYVFRYRFSTLHIRETKEGSGTSIISTGRTQVMKAAVSFVDSIFFKVKVYVEGKPDKEYKLNAWEMDDVNLLTRSVKPEEGSLQFPIKSENINTTIDIINDAAVPCSFVSAEWTALWYPKTRRI